MTSKTVYIYQAVDDRGKRVTRYRLDQNQEYGTLIGSCVRLIADTGKVLTDGNQQVSCIDTADPSQWTEIDEPQPEPEENNEESEN